MHYLAHSLEAFTVGFTWHPGRFQDGGWWRRGDRGGGLRSKTSTPCSNGGVLGRLFRGKQVYFLLLGAQLVLQESQPRPLLSLSSWTQVIICQSASQNVVRGFQVFLTPFHCNTIFTGRLRGYLLFSLSFCPKCAGFSSLYMMWQTVQKQIWEVRYLLSSHTLNKATCKNLRWCHSY